MQLSVPNVAGFSGSGNGPYDETQDVNGYRAAGSNCATTGEPKPAACRQQQPCSKWAAQLMVLYD